MRAAIIAILLAGCTTSPLGIEPTEGEASDAAVPGVVLEVSAESTDRLWVNATVRNDGDAMYTLTGTPPQGCAPSFRFTLEQDDEVVLVFPEAACAIYGERPLGPGASESMTLQWDMAPGTFDLTVRIDVFEGVPWEEHPSQATLVFTERLVVS